MYSAGTGQAALDRLSDSDADANSVFTRRLVPLIRTKGLGLQEVAGSQDSNTVNIWDAASGAPPIHLLALAYQLRDAIA